MRRPSRSHALACAAAVLSLLPSQVNAAAAAPAVVEQQAAGVELTEVKRTVPGTADTRFEVTATSDLGIRGMRVRVREYDQYGDEIGIVHDFALVDGTANDGTWRSASALALGPKNYRVRVEIWDQDLVKHAFDRFILSAPKPELVDYSMSPTTAKPEQYPRYRGRLIVRAEDGSERPAAGVTLWHECVPGGTGPSFETDANGRFSGGIWMDGPANCRVLSATDDDYLGFSSPVTAIDFVYLPTRVTGGISGATPLTVGREATVTGRLERQRKSGEWAVIPQGTVRLSFKAAATGAERVVGTAVTGNDGSFTAWIPITESGTLIGSFTGFNDNSGTHGYLESPSDIGRLQATYRTAVADLTATPNPVAKGAQLTFTGRLTRSTTDADRNVVTGGSVDVEYSTDRTRWTVKGSGRTDGQGHFRVPVTANADGYWRVNYRGNIPGSNGSEHTPDQPAVVHTGLVDVRYRTAISSFGAGPEPVKKGWTLTVSGVLKRSTDGSTFKVWKGRPVYVYYQVEGSTEWTYAGKTTTDNNGKFRKGFKASTDATWKAVYKGDTGHLAADSATDHVDVR